MFGSVQESEPLIEEAMALGLWVRGKRGNRALECSGAGVFWLWSEVNEIAET
jgi:hypothetical protein